MRGLEFCALLARKATAAKDMASWCAVSARLEDHVDDATVHAREAGYYAERARLLYELAEHVCPSSSQAKEALEAATAAANFYLACKVAVAVLGARAGKVVKVVSHPLEESMSDRVGEPRVNGVGTSPSEVGVGK